MKNDTALAFSGGKDSLACWHLWRDRDPYVIWVNTGKAYPETLEVVEMVRAQSRFIEVKTDQEAQNRRCGLPSDLVPVDSTASGMLISGPRPTMIQNYLECCWENISKPLLNAAKELGVKYLVRGQRTDEDMKSVARDGHVIDGITCLQPIENWTRQQVFDFLSTKGEIPAHFALDHSSMDCHDCTAFLTHSIDRAEWTRVRWPELHAGYMHRLRLVRDAIMPSAVAMNTILQGQ